MAALRVRGYALPDGEPAVAAEQAARTGWAKLIINWQVGGLVATLTWRDVEREIIATA